MVEWELAHNDLFEYVSSVGARPLVLRQVAGLPMGGHLSAAALVELVALQRELEQPWPSELDGLPTARYRDNFFVACPEAKLAVVLSRAAALTALLGMPVKLEGSSKQHRIE